MRHNFKNALRLGDCFWHCMFMRRAAKAHPGRQFALYCNGGNIAQLMPVISDLHNVSICDILNAPPDSIECWIGEWWYTHPDNMDIVLFLTKWFAYMAEKCGIEPVIHKREDLLADYPALEEHNKKIICPFLIINSQPQSGQWHYDEKDMLKLIRALSKYQGIITTAPTAIPGVGCTSSGGMDITEIGRLSQRSGSIIGCATGPFWPTCNVWNVRPMRERIVFLDQQMVDYGQPMVHMRTIPECMEYLSKKGVI